MMTTKKALEIAEKANTLPWPAEAIEALEELARVVKAQGKVLDKMRAFLDKYPD